MNIRFSRICFVVAITLGWSVLNASAQESPNVAGPKASIEDVAWIAGQWHGEAMGGQFEESWSPPSAGTMMGMFKFSKNDEVNFYELLTIVADKESLILRLKHFGSDLVGWEEKDKSVEFALVKLTPQTAEFDGLIFRKISENEMHIEVVVTSSDRDPRTILFKCHRAATKPRPR